MSIELLLVRFDKESDEATQGSILKRLDESVHGTLYKLNRDDIDRNVLDSVLFVELPGGTTEIHATHAIFPIQNLDPLTMNVLFEVAMAADMVVLCEGGGLTRFDFLYQGL